MLPKNTSSQSLLEVQDIDIDRNMSTETSPSCMSGGPSPSCLAGEVRQVIREEMSGFRDELACICRTIADFNRRADAIESRLTALEDRFSAEKAREDTRLSTFEEKLSLCKVQGSSESLNSILTQLQNQLNDREQEYFMNDVEMSGLAEVNGENLVHITTLIGKKLGFELEERDVVTAERLCPRRALLEGEGQGRPRLVMVKLARRTLRDQLLRAARVRRHTDSSGIIEGSPRRFYVNERLTRANRQLFYKARHEAQQKEWRYVWTRNGNIYIRRDDNATAYRIRSNADVEKFFSSVAS